MLLRFDPAHGAEGSPDRRRGESVCAGEPLRGPKNRWYIPCKVVVEFLAALGLLLLAAPLLLTAALLVKLTSRGPVFCSQVRAGRYGRHFHLYRLRTLAHEGECLFGPRRAAVNGPRLTWLGRFLRRTRLDGLPQLWNVVRGDMSLVGPSPERPEFLPQMEQLISHYRERLLVRPGMTGLAQVQHPADTDVASARRKLAHDLYYVQALGPGLDLRILLGTALKLVGVSVPVLRKVCGLPGEESVEDRYRLRLVHCEILAPARYA